MTSLRIGTRGSALALWQANTVARLIAEHGGPSCEIVVIRTSGDETQAPRVSQVQSTKRTFVKEIEDALLDGRVDLGVHSSKDLSAVFPKDLIVGATLARDDPRDAVLLPHGEHVETLHELQARIPAASRIGTSSVRRTAQLRTIFSAASFLPVRGNVDTRLRKLEAGDCDVLVLACAGLKRLGLENRISFALPPDTCIPAPGQGIVAVQVREGRPDLRPVLNTINDAAAMDALTAERAIVRALGGGCQMPLGAYARIEGDVLSVAAVVIGADGWSAVRQEARGHRTDAGRIGESVARLLLEHGAEEILRASRT